MGRGSAAKSRNPEERGCRGAAVAGAATAAEGEAGGKGGVVRDGFVLDFISGTKVLRETPREQVRQRIARALFHEYGVSVDDMEPDFPAPVGGRRRRVDLAIFGSREEHTLGNLQRVVVCRPEPKQNKRGAVKMRDYEQAAKDIAEIEPFFEEIEACKYGLWTNGLEFFFVRKKATKFQVDAEPIGDWPPAERRSRERSSSTKPSADRRTTPSSWRSPRRSASIGAGTRCTNAPPRVRS